MIAMVQSIVLLSMIAFASNATMPIRNPSINDLKFDKRYHMFDA